MTPNASPRNRVAYAAIGALGFGLMIKFVDWRVSGKPEWLEMVLLGGIILVLSWQIFRDSRAKRT